MNFKLVLKAYSTLRQLTDDESALLTTLRGMSDGERELLVEEMRAGKVVKKTAAQRRKIDHCAACGYTRRAAVHKDAACPGYHEFQPPGQKSARASSLQRQLQQTPRPSATCVHEVDGDGGLMPCGAPAGDRIHDERFGGSHEFQGGERVAGAAGGD